MTAELNQLAEELLPEGSASDEQGKQRAKNDKSLRQRLLDSWDGKVTRKETKNKSSPEACKCKQRQTSAVCLIAAEVYRHKQSLRGDRRDKAAIMLLVVISCMTCHGCAASQVCSICHSSGDSFGSSTTAAADEVMTC